MFEDEDINLKIYALNNELEGFCKKTKHLSFLDLHPEFLGNSGEMDPKYTFDGVHLTEAGYSHWAGLIQPYL
jgi:lysophospholipase L1-like esterase